MQSQPSNSFTRPFREGAISRRGLIAGASAASILALITACRPATPNDVGSVGTLTLNMPPYGSEEIEKYLSTFSEQFGINVELSVIPQDYHPTTETRLRAGTAYSVVQADEGYPEKWFENGWIVPLDDHIDLSGLSDDMFPSIREAAQYNGQTIALPGHSLTKVMVYNEEILNSANFSPATSWDEFYEQCVELKAKELARHPYVPMWTKAFGLATYFAVGDSYSRGANEWFDPETLEPMFHEDPAVIETIEFWRRLWDAGVVPQDVVTADHNAMTELFGSGSSAYFQHNFGQVLPTMNLDPEKYGRVAGKIKLMLNPGPTNECVTGSNWVCLTVEGAEQGAGADLANFLGGVDIDGDYLVAREFRALDMGSEPGYEPVLEDSTVVSQWSEFVDVELFAEQKAKTRTIGVATGANWFTEWLDRTASELQSAIIGDKSPTDALKASADFVNSQL